MAALDAIHEVVKVALVKDGWTITADPYTIEYRDTKLFADLAAERPLAAERGGLKIVVEVKSFLGPSPFRDLELAIGQYHIYRHLLESRRPSGVCILPSRRRRIRSSSSARQFGWSSIAHGLRCWSWTLHSRRSRSG